LNEIASSHCLHNAEWTQLQQGFATGEMGFRDQLQRGNSEPLMSALGQKRTFECVRAMSALPPKADIRRHDWNVRFAICSTLIL
jgi:hypothetical protein